MLRLSLLAALIAAAGPAWAGPPAKAAPAPAQAPAQAGFELVLAVDGSASITPGGLEFQLRGHAAAIQDPGVVDSIVMGGGMAVALAVFSGPHTLKLLVPWTVITDADGAKAFADRVQTAPRGVLADATALGSAIEDASRLFDGNGIDAPRRVIDLVSNGFSNSGPDPAWARDRAVARDITVNALAILDEFPWLEHYYQENVVGGSGSFVKTAFDRDSFVEALRQKLMLEIAALP